MRAKDALPFRATRLGAPYDALGTLPVSVLLDSVRSLYNVGAFFRTADAVGVEHLYLCGITAAPPHRGIVKTALGAECRVPWSRIDDGAALLESLRARGVEVAIVETSTHAVDLYDWRPAFPVCVVFGHEVNGVSASLLEGADVFVRIPMRGIKHSLNVATAGGVILYELLRKYRA